MCFPVPTSYYQESEKLEKKIGLNDKKKKSMMFI
jgi:hypothetical protein